LSRKPREIVIPSGEEGRTCSQEIRRTSDGGGAGHCHAQTSSPRRLVVTLTTRHLKKGNKIRRTGLGILQVRKRAAGMGRNPATGEVIKIKAGRKIAFRPAKELKEAV
jgi:nucleoid DNA-binding protein